MQECLFLRLPVQGHGADTPLAAQQVNGEVRMGTSPSSSHCSAVSVHPCYWDPCHSYGADPPIRSPVLLGSLLLDPTLVSLVRVHVCVGRGQRVGGQACK